MRVTDIPEIDQLSTPEKILLVEDLWDSIALDESGVPVSQSHKEELDRKTAELSVNSGQSFIARGTARKNREQAMTYVLRFLPIIEEDALAGYTWYEEESPMKPSFFLSSVSIANFKAVRKSGTVKLTPLTVFIGNNGSGKSSLIEGLETYQETVSRGSTLP